MEEFPLLIFTICIHASIGIMLFVAIAKCINTKGIFKPAILTATILVIIGLILCLLHLGRPLRALNSLMNFGTSWLSREIWFSSVFAGLTVLTAILVLFKPTFKKAIHILAIAAAVVGLADVAVIASVYVSSSVPVWRYGAIYFEFYAAAISMGALLFLALSMKEAANMKKIVRITVAIAVIVQVTMMVSYYINLGVNQSLAVRESLSIYASYGVIMAVQWLSIILGTILMFWPAKKEKSLLYCVYGATALIIIGQICGRFLFYVTMVASQVGLH